MIYFILSISFDTGRGICIENFWVDNVFPPDPMTSGLVEPDVGNYYLQHHLEMINVWDAFSIFINIHDHGMFLSTDYLFEQRILNLPLTSFISDSHTKLRIIASSPFY